MANIRLFAKMFTAKCMFNNWWLSEYDARFCEIIVVKHVAIAGSVWWCVCVCVCVLISWVVSYRLFLFGGWLLFYVHLNMYICICIHIYTQCWTFSLWSDGRVCSFRRHRHIVIVQKWQMQLKRKHHIMFSIIFSGDFLFSCQFCQFLHEIRYNFRVSLNIFRRITQTHTGDWIHSVCRIFRCIWVDVVVLGDDPHARSHSVVSMCVCHVGCTLHVYI